MQVQVFIPKTITVHLGRPNSNARDVTVSFPDYIKNVASSEIYPTWPESALRANIYAQVSFALNRVYTEWYRSQGYNFDITNSTQYDQSYIDGRDIFENISRLVDELFNNYLRRFGRVEPFFAQFCNGTTVTCSGLSQWGTVNLANSGYTPYQILTNYYGNSIEIVNNAPVASLSESYPGFPLRRYDRGNLVRFLQIRLNRVSNNYPRIPKVSVDGVFGLGTEQAVKTFQEIFGLAADGVVGKATWYRLSYLYASVKRLSELNSEGVQLEEVSKQLPEALKEGDSGPGVRLLQYYLSLVAQVNDQVPAVDQDSYFGPSTRVAVTRFQRAYGLPVDGLVGQQTWATLYQAARGIENSIPEQDVTFMPEPYPGVVLKRGLRGPSVLLLQQYLNGLATFEPTLSRIDADGIFGPATQRAVQAFQRLYQLTPDGLVGPTTWNELVDAYTNHLSGITARSGQYPGFVLREEQ